MPVEQELRTAFAEIVATAPDVPGTLQAVERRALAIRRRRRAGLGAGVAALAAVGVVAAALPLLRATPRPPTVEELARRFATTVVRDVVVVDHAAYVFPDPATRGPAAAAPPDSLGDAVVDAVRQLPLGPVVGIRGGRLVRVERDRLVDLARADAFVPGRRGDDVWLVPRRPPSRPYDVLHLRADGRALGTVRLQGGWRLAGEAADGSLVVEVSRPRRPSEKSGTTSGAGDTRDVVLVRPGAERPHRVLGTDTDVDYVENGFVVHGSRYEACWASDGGCDDVVLDTRTGRTRPLAHDHGTGITRARGALSPDGRWWAFAESVATDAGPDGSFTTEESPDRIRVVDLDRGTSYVVPGSTSRVWRDAVVWSGGRLLFAVYDESTSGGRIAVHVPATGATSLGAPLLAPSATVAGALDLR